SSPVVNLAMRTSVRVPTVIRVAAACRHARRLPDLRPRRRSLTLLVHGEEGQLTVRLEHRQPDVADPFDALLARGRVQVVEGHPLLAQDAGEGLTAPHDDDGL